MNFGRGFPIPPENQLGRLDFWVPATPEKPIPARSNPITMDAQVSQLDRANWSDLLGIYGGLLQETVNCTAPTDDFNQVVGLAGDYLNLDDTPANGLRLDQNGGSFVQNSGYDCTWNNNLSTENVGILASSNGSVFDNSFPQVEKRWTEPTNLDNCLVSKQRINGDNLQTVPNDGFQVPYQCHFNLNSPPRSETDAASSSVSSSLQFAPVTPEQRKQLENNQLSETLNLAVYESSSQEKDELDKAIGNNCDELLQHIVESSAAISIPFKEKNGSEEGGNNLGIDINKTPQQKTPKRRKHRPKVIKEGKAKRGPKPKAATNENQPAKRKYVRKNSLQNSSDQQGNELSEKQTEKRKYVRKKGIENVVNETVVDEGRSSSCRRVLNFDLENKNGHQIETNQENRMALNLNLDPQVVADEWTGQRSTQNDAKNQQLVASDVATSKMLAFMALTQQKATPAPLKGHNLNAIARNMNVIKGNQWQNGYYNQTNLDRTRETTLQNIAQLLTKDISSSDERRGFKRDSCHNTEPMGSQFLYREMLRANGNDFGADCSESFKRKRTIDNVHESITGSSCIDANGVQRENPTPYISSFQRENASNLSSWINRLTGNGYIQHKAAEDYYQNHQNSSEVHSHTEKLRQKSGQVTNLNLMTAITNHNAMKPRLQEMVATPNHVQPIETLKAIVSAKKKTVKPASAKQASSKDRVVLEEHKDDQGYRKAKIQSYQEYSKRERGPKQEQKIRISVESITYQLKGLNINSGSSEIAERNQRALVPFNAGGTIVPFEGLGAIKRRKPRPKVDLDPETNRIWNLLMGIEASETTEAMNKDKEKWWEEERKVFQGRVDSFIARMHLVQGDRRFSRWKGSVVDSVIGVFLTQNVSDHLSSSAYMSLASKFPLKSTTASKTCYQKETTVLVEEPEIRILEKDEIIKFQEKIAREPAYHQRSFEQRTNIALISGRSTLEDEHRRRAEEAVLPRNSLDSLILQASMGNKFSLGSNSEGEDPTHNLLRLARSSTFQEYSRPVVQRFAHGHNQSVNPASNWQYPGLDRDISMRGSNGFSYPIDPMIRQTQDSNLPSTTNYWLSKISGSRTSEVAHFSTLRQESQSALPASAAGNTNANSADYMSNRMRHAAGNEITFLHSGMPRFQTRPHANNHKEEGPKTSQLERMIIKEAPRPVEGLAKWQSPLGKQLSDNPSISGRTADAEERNTAKDELKLLQNKATEANAKWQINSSIKEGTDTSSVKKKKAESEKKNEYDWDSLRRRVQCSSERKERGKDAMDSLDYEALRCANVSEISNAIKERGMNNLLADRIKDFLNRLVREHGSIDLEWLRDVPPDKAKDYLLSIRGLGLKSVECVRLLTLHHLAFPVDTNVGRIAVRLGWVPLQPLPESLQLHLLELYPILESIQKYLWPRLCKLDQLTLYELHYQMITFGKVFCTKSKPNCNACPMRGECRHFASAFASARLALPGPEERSMTCSVVPIAANETPAAVLTPLPLPPLENNISTELGYTAGKCEPIIEEPATPEPPAEVSQSDIEDAFYEDPDEIPTIKLNMEEFSQNLQTFMQENMDLQEGDMSKALVALSQEVASIPQPKLKNVSRLRTEHQVYELPDSHPLLNRLDRREPDDPSPYLLAIWTPGETATSIQPPERRCGSQESGNLCNEKTCFSCNSVREANSQIVRGTLLIPCRTAMRGSFPLNGTYFQVNEVFADHESSLNPIDVPRAWLWNLSRRTVYFGTSVSTIFKGLSTEGIQYCFWRGFVCVRGFDQKTRAPRPLMARLHFPASKLAKARNEGK